VGFCRQGFYEDSSLNVKESKSLHILLFYMANNIIGYEKLRSEQQRLEALKKTQHQKAANQLPPISSLLGQKKSQKGGAGLDISFVFHHPIYGIEASVEQWSRSNKNRV
jgi:hypothetical protein